MRKLKVLALMVLVSLSVCGQTPSAGQVIEYKLPAEDNVTGTFYLGRFSIGTYEINANITGIHANNKGWKIIVGTDWGGNSRKFRTIYNNIQGEFIYQKHSDGQFDLWWDAKHYQSYNWTPYVKVEFQYGSCNYLNTEPTRTNTIRLDDPKDKIIASSILSDNPNITDDWNSIWQSGFFEGHNKPNAPEANQWFWGLNLGHTSNHSDYRYGGQLVINNSSIKPTMYFRSRGKEGTGTWAKIIHNKGDQRIDGNLTINGQIFSEEIEVKDIAATNIKLAGDLAANNITLTTNGQTADFVFSPTYNLKPLSEVESFIKANKHLPEIPSAAQMEEQGVNLAEMNKLLLQKVEELTLYSIEMEKARRKEQGEREKLNEALGKEQSARGEMEERLEKLEALLQEITSN